MDFGFYSGIRAESLAVERKNAVNFKSRKMANLSEATSLFVFSSLQERTSPEQLCGRLKVVFGLKISHPTLYKRINEDKRNGGKLYLSLRHGKKKYRKKLNKDTACAVVNKKNIAERPAVANEKLEPMVIDWPLTKSKLTICASCSVITADPGKDKTTQRD